MNIHLIRSHSSCTWYTEYPTFTELNTPPEVGKTYEIKIDTYNEIALHTRTYICFKPYPYSRSGDYFSSMCICYGEVVQHHIHVSQWSMYPLVLFKVLHIVDLPALNAMPAGYGRALPTAFQPNYSGQDTNIHYVPMDIGFGDGLYRFYQDFQAYAWHEGIGLIENGQFYFLWVSFEVSLGEKLVTAGKIIPPYQEQEWLLQMCALARENSVHRERTKYDDE